MDKDKSYGLAIAECNLGNRKVIEGNKKYKREKYNMLLF